MSLVNAPGLRLERRLLHSVRQLVWPCLVGTLLEAAPQGTIVRCFLLRHNLDDILVREDVDEAAALRVVLRSDRKRTHMRA